MTLPGNPPVPTELVHHIGIAVVDLTSSMDFYHELFGLEPGPIIVRDDIKVRGCFISVGETNLELLQGTDPGSMISEHISRSGEGHHVCFEVGEVAEKLKSLEALGIPLLGKVPRGGLMGGQIGFLDSAAAGGVLIELAQHNH